MRQIIIDIDGTIAATNNTTFASVCNCRLKLGIDQDRLENISREEFLLLPEVQRYREDVGIAIFEAQLALLRFFPEYIESLLPMPGSIDAIHSLSHLAEISYATVRHFVPEYEHAHLFNPMIEQATYNWLQVHSFPHPNKVSFFDRLTKKVDHAQSFDSAILIDDLYDRILQIEANPTFILVGFRAEEEQSQSFIKLPSWKNISCLLDLLKGEAA